MDPDDLADAWGNRFRSAIVPNSAGVLEIYIWTEWIDDNGRTTLIGAKASADGTTTRFGLPPKD
jgi:hypothetical protein